MTAAETPMVRRDDADDCRQAGEFCWLVATTYDPEEGFVTHTRPARSDERPTHVFLRTPVRGIGALIAVAPEKLANGASWRWDGDRERPTLTPSINGGAGAWHGWVQAGVMIDAEDSPPHA